MKNKQEVKHGDDSKVDQLLVSYDSYKSFNSARGSPSNSPLKRRGSRDVTKYKVYANGGNKNGSRND